MSFRTVQALALVFLLAAAQFAVAVHAPAHLLEKSPAHGKSESACTICAAAHALDSGLVLAAAPVFFVPKADFRPLPETRRLTAARSKDLHATGPPA